MCSPLLRTRHVGKSKAQILTYNEHRKQNLPPLSRSQPKIQLATTLPVEGQGSDYLILQTSEQHRSKGLKAPSWSGRQDVLRAQTWAHTANSAVDVNISKPLSVVEMYNLLLFKTWRLYSPPLLTTAAPVPEQEPPGGPEWLRCDGLRGGLSTEAEKNLKTVAVCNQHNSWQNAEIQLLGTERKHHRGADQPNQATTKRKRKEAASNGRQSIWAPNIKNLRGSLQLYNQCPWCKVTHSYLSYANRKGEAWHPFHQAKHLCALWYCPLSRLLQKLNSFKLHTHTQLERNFLSSQLINLTVRLLFSEHILYELNKLYGRVDCQGSRKLETWCLTTARNSRLQESLAAAFAPQLL